MKIDFNKEEIQFLKKKGFEVTGDTIKYVLADAIVDKLGDNDVGIAADIITKITTNNEW
jgi:hypothetical protein